MVGHEAGKGKHLGRMGALQCRMRNGTTFKVGSGFKDEQREVRAARRGWVGVVVVVGGGVGSG